MVIGSEALLDKCHFPIMAVAYALFVFELIYDCNEVSVVERTSPTSSTFVLTPYLPVRIEALVGVQTGYDHKLSNVIPEFMRVCNVGISGFIFPSEKFGVASFPMSSAMTSNIFGFFTSTSPESIGVSEGELQLKQKRENKNSENCFINDIRLNLDEVYNKKFNLNM
jgi:hypothetical protein